MSRQDTPLIMSRQDKPQTMNKQNMVGIALEREAIKAKMIELRE
jgi:hypothetical protein